MTCDVYMGADDIQRQMPNVFRMKLLGANVVSVDSGSRTLKDADERSHARMGWRVWTIRSTSSALPQALRRIRKWYAISNA